MRRREFVEIVGAGAFGMLCGCGEEEEPSVFYRVNDEISLGRTYIVSRCLTSARLVSPEVFTAVRGGALFAGYTERSSEGFWFTDGTTAGTRSLLTLTLGYDVLSIDSSPADSVFYLTLRKDQCSYYSQTWTPAPS